MPLTGPTDKKRHWQYTIFGPPTFTAGTYHNASVTINEFGQLLDIGSSTNGLAIDIERNADFTAQLSTLHPVDVTAGVVTVTAAATIVAGQIFVIGDSRGNASINNILVDFVSTGIPLHGSLQNYIINVDSGMCTFTYINATIGWMVTK